MPRLRKRLFLFVGVIIVAVLVGVAINTNLFKKDAMADSATVTYYQQFQGAETTVGNFEVNYTEAWCMEHDLAFVPQGTALTSLDGYPKVISASSSNTDQMLFKIMYYGSTQGFGRIPISIAASYVYTNGRSPRNLSWEGYKDPGNSLTAQDLYNYAANAALPNGIMTVTLWDSGIDGYQTLGQFSFQAITYTSINVSKVWRDNSNAYNTRPASVSIDLLRNNTKIKTVTFSGTGNNWMHTESGLEKYDANGNAYTYTWKESGVPSGYSMTQSGNTVTNTLYGKVNISGTKTWKFDGAPDRVRPTKITVVLLRNGVKYQEKVLTADDMTSSDEEEDSAVWEFIFENLDKYDADGVLYEYTIEELEVDQFETVIEETDITNTYKPDLVNIHVDKVWLNDSEADRPGKIDVELICDGKVIDTVELNNETGWGYDWEDLDANYEYTVHESFQVPGYYPGVTTGDVEHGFTIENKKMPKNPKTFDEIGVAGVVLATSTIAGVAITIRKRR